MSDTRRTSSKSRWIRLSRDNFEEVHEHMAKAKDDKQREIVEWTDIPSLPWLVATLECGHIVKYARTDPPFMGSRKPKRTFCETCFPYTPRGRRAK